MRLAVRRTVVLALAAILILLPAIPAAAQTAPRLASLTIDVWPEFDRPSSVLVIYRGQFGPDATLPAQVTIRIPASAGQPSAVAAPQPGSENAPVNQWADLIVTKKVTTTRSGDWIAVSFAPPSRLFNIEFYDNLSTVTFDRRYTLTWPGDLAADTVVMNVREPFGTTGFQSTPPLPEGQRDDEGLIAHQQTLGAWQSGQSFTLGLTYHREDKRTSVEALKLATPAAAQPVAPAAPVAASSPPWLLIGAAAVGLMLIIAGVVWYFRSQRSATFRPYEPPAMRHSKGRRSVRTSRPSRSRPQPRVAMNSAETEDSSPGFCTQCGKPLRPDDVFCPRCGARVKGK